MVTVTANERLTFFSHPMPLLSNFPQEEMIDEEIDDGRATSQIASKQISRTYTIQSYQFANYARP